MKQLLHAFKYNDNMRGENRVIKKYISVTFVSLIGNNYYGKNSHRSTKYRRAPFR